jgi:hypothetical protein
MVLFALMSLAWGFDAILVSGAGDIWIGFAIVTGILLVLTLAAFLFAWRKLNVGAPKPDMAINEAKKIRDTVSVKPGEAPAGAIGAGEEPAGAIEAGEKPAVAAEAGEKT